ncbi:alanine/glycine:cation symporter family protein [Salinibacter ruber]|uniref:alanine/glycine:cation symporter family protein n=1 Tax=Salinibacter ruber TaxID=146919 RepID=UPI00160E41E2|nr:sodium:alanine symporter family protein [Salinibacter ruber]MBB4089087.1 AGCS family alanine or glycine:cation symporter [Salinibacter ruber]
MSFLEILADGVDFLVDFVWGFGIPTGTGNDIPIVVILLLGAGLYLTLQLGVVQFRRLKHGFEVMTGMYDDPDEPGDISHFQALTTALSATVGTGNIVGVALAIHYGGPGALLWMWVTAVLGMATKFSEVTLAQHYRDVDITGAGEESRWLGTVSGGPMYYIEKGLGSNWTWMAVLSAALLGITSFLTGNANQANSITDTLAGYSGLVGLEPFAMKLIVAAFVAGIVGLVIIGGVTRIGRVTSIIAPVMAAIYVLAGLAILALNASEVPGAFASIVTNAFNPSSGVAGTGAGIFMLTMIYGVQRGLFSNEAGMGSAPIAHSAAQTDEPVSEGVVALLEPFIDTIVICSITGLVIVVTGVWDDQIPRQLDLDAGAHSYRVAEKGGIIADETPPTEIKIVDGAPQVEEGTPEFAWNQAVVDSFYVDCAGDCETASDLRRPFSGVLNTERNVAIAEDGTEYANLYGPAVESGAPLTQMAFAQGLSPLGDWGGLIVVFSVLLFAISTSISWSYYGDRCAIYLFGEGAVLPYKVAFLTVNFLGGIAPLATVWAIGDIALGLVIIPNLVGVALLSDKLKEITNSYFEREAWLDNVQE